MIFERVRLAMSLIENLKKVQLHVPESSQARKIAKEGVQEVQGVRGVQGEFPARLLAPDFGSGPPASLLELLVLLVLLELL